LANAILAIVGDLCPAGVAEGPLSGPAAGQIWRNVRPLLDGADFAIANLECPLTARPQQIIKSGPSLWATPNVASGIVAAGFHALCLANNHILDAGTVGLEDTLEACSRHGLLSCGAGMDYQTATTTLITRAGELTLAVLCLAENEFSCTRDDSPGAWPLNLPENARQIAAARQRSDFVLVLLHGGAEYHPLPSPMMQERCRFFIDQGADAVVCHHSHVVSGYEYYREKPIVYGVGNFFFPSASAERAAGQQLGCLANLRISEHAVIDLELVPLTLDRTSLSIGPVPDSAQGQFRVELKRLNDIIHDPTELRSAWSQYCREKGSWLLSCIWCMTWAESWLLSRRLWPTKRLRLSNRLLARQLNVLSCESHHEACLHLLRSTLDERLPR